MEDLGINVDTLSVSVRQLLPANRTPAVATHGKANEWSNFPLKGSQTSSTYYKMLERYN